MLIEISEEWIVRQSRDVQAVIPMLLAHIDKQDRRIAELEAKLGINSKNSSQPPSSKHPQLPDRDAKFACK